MNIANREIVRIPEDLMDPLEYVFYRMGGYRQLVRFICAQEEIDTDRMEMFISRYEELHLEYQTRLSAIIAEYASEVDIVNCEILPQFNLNALVIKRRGG